MEASAASTAGNGVAEVKAKGDALSAGQGDAPSAAAAAAAAVMGSEGVPVAEVDPGILQDMLLFFVHLALHACRGWGAPPAPESTPVCTAPKSVVACKAVHWLFDATCDLVARSLFLKTVTNHLWQLWHC